MYIYPYFKGYINRYTDITIKSSIRITNITRKYRKRGKNVFITFNTSVI